MLLHWGCYLCCQQRQLYILHHATLEGRPIVLCETVCIHGCPSVLRAGALCHTRCLGQGVKVCRLIFFACMSMQHHPYVCWKWGLLCNTVPDRGGRCGATSSLVFDAVELQYLGCGNCCRVSVFRLVLDAGSLSRESF